MFAVGADPEQRRRLVETSATLLVAPLAAAAVLAVPGVLVAHRWLEVDRLDLGLVLLFSALYTVATVLPFTILRAEERLGSFIRINAFLTVMTTVFTVTFVVLFGWGVTGWFAGGSLAVLLTWTVSARILPWPRGLAVHRDVLRESLRIGLPLIPHQLSLWGLNLANRVILVGLVAKAQVAIFTLAATIALPVTLLAGALVYGVFPSYGQASADPALRKGLSPLVTVQVAAVASLGVAVALIGPLFCNLLFPPIYARAATLVPMIAFGYALGALYAVPLNAAALLAGKTAFAWVATLIAAGTNVAALYAAVPAYGLEGAALAVCVGNAALFLGTVIYARAVAPGVLHYQWGRLAQSLLVLTACYVGAVLTTADDSAADLLLRLVWLVGGLAALGMLGILPVSLRRGRNNKARPVGP